ncbi:AMP-binding protein, partial [Eubacteriales bacterium OttesenSCG-928-G02]|nr:AMP-binding protein [Eubacteriales bacterium OttesenSCG-928-G02]
ATDKKIAIIGNNCYYWALSYLAATTVGVVVPIDKELHIDDVCNLIKKAECSMVIGEKKYVDDILSKIPNLGAMYFDDNDNINSVSKQIVVGKHYIAAGDKSFFDIKIDPDETKIIIFTSGTTGNAKGVCLSQRNICEDIMSVTRVVKIDSKTRVMSMLPLHHTYECTLGFILILYKGACITYNQGLRYVTKNIVEYKPTVLVVVPLIIEKILEKAEYTVREELPKKYKSGTEKLTFSELLTLLPYAIRKIVERKIRSSLGDRLRLLIVGAAPISPETIKCYNILGIRTLQGYGLTETSPLLVGNNDFFMNPHSVGLPIPGVSIKIHEPDPETGIGEIIAKGKMVMKGYYNDPEATNEVIRDGWFHTGDLGYLDEEGYLYLTGRIKNVIITKNGKNIYPEELEEKLNASAYIHESLIVGELAIDEDMFVKAKIFPNLDAIKDSLEVAIPTKEEIYASVKATVDDINEKLPSYKRIKKISLRDVEFEKTTTKKIKRHGDNVDE